MSGYKVGMKLAANYLKRSGYRLLQKRRWSLRHERVSASRYYGETEELLPKYAWYDKNGRDRSWPVGNKKPNDFGLFERSGECVYLVSGEFQAVSQVKGK